MDSISVARNKKAFHNYTILEKMEAGIQLRGCEVKSLREGRASIADAYVRIDKGEAYVINMHILPYSHVNSFIDVDPTRKRKLLLHKAELKRLIGVSERKGYALVPLSLYFNVRGKAKIQLGVGEGKKQHDKRDSIKKKMHDRDMQRALKQRHK